MFKLTDNPDLIMCTADHDGIQAKTMIPKGHRYWAVYADWLAAGNTPQPAMTLNEAKTDKITILRLACRTEIFSGYDSLALGTSHHYPLSETDQANLQLALSEAIINTADTTWTTDVQALATGETGPAYKAHTAEQVKQVAIDISTSKKTALAKLAALIATVKAAATEADVQVVVW